MMFCRPVAMFFYSLVFIQSIGLAHAQEPSAAPGTQSSLGKFFGAVKKGATDGVNNGTQLTGNVKVLGYTMMHSDLAGNDQPAFCLDSAETGKLLTVAPMFGRPYQRADGTTGFTQMAKPAGKSHDKIEVNLQGVLPGLNCADLIAKDKLIAYVASGAAVTMAPTAANADPSKYCTQSMVPVDDGTGDQWCTRHDAMVIGRVHFEMNKGTGNYEQRFTRFDKAVSIGILQEGGKVDSQGNVTLPSNVQAGWDKVDRIQKEGNAKIQADMEARDASNAEKSMTRKAAFEKCKPLIKTDNAKMDAFKACVKEATS